MIVELTLVRHGQSTANVAFPAADARGLLESGLTGRDADVELSGLGRTQAAALGGYLAALNPDARPDVVVTSPFRRTRETWAIAADGLGLPTPSTDDRLVDRGMGELELLTRAAIEARYPEESRRRAADWYHYRPPNGENFADVRNRLAAFLADAHEAYAGRRVLVVAHDSVVLMVRGVIENLDAAAIEAVERAAGGIRNASVTRFTAGPAGLQLVAYNTVDHLDVVTAVPDEG